MKFVARDQIADLADVHDIPRKPLTRAERLARWADVLMRDPDRMLRSLGEIEFVARAERPLLRSENSPLTVAFEDPILRTDGLQSDRYGEAIRYFELSERQAHRLLCSCMNGLSMRAGTTASRVRKLAERRPARAFLPWLGAWSAVAAFWTLD